MSLQWWQGPCQPLDHVARVKAENRQRQLTKPAGSLGRLEKLAIHLAALQGREKPSLDKLWIAIFAGDHGVVAEGVSAYPQAVTDVYKRQGKALPVPAAPSSSRTTAVAWSAC